MYKKVSIKGHINRLNDPDIIDLMFASAKKNPQVSGDLNTRYKEYAKMHTNKKRVQSQKRHNSYFPQVLKSSEQRINDLLVRKLNKLESFCGNPKLKFAPSFDQNLSNEMKKDILKDLIRTGPFHYIVAEGPNWLEHLRENFTLMETNEDGNLQYRNQPLFKLTQAMKLGFNPFQKGAYAKDYSGYRRNSSCTTQKQYIGWHETNIGLEYIRSLKALHFFLHTIQNQPQSGVFQSTMYYTTKTVSLKIKYSMDFRELNVINFVIDSIQLVNTSTVNYKMGYVAVNGAKLALMCNSLGIKCDYTIPDPPKTPAKVRVGKLCDMYLETDKYLEQMQRYINRIEGYKNSLILHCNKVRNWKDHI